MRQADSVRAGPVFLVDQFEAERSRFQVTELGAALARAEFRGFQDAHSRLSRGPLAGSQQSRLSVNRTDRESVTGRTLGPGLDIRASSARPPLAGGHE